LYNLVRKIQPVRWGVPAARLRLNIHHSARREERSGIKAYKTVGLFGEDEIIINKSRFIGACRSCESEEQALAFLSERRAAFKDASHNCLLIS
jgi:hypothetical protein